MASPATIGTNDQATILLNLFDGTRQPIGPGVKNLLLRIIDGNQKQLLSDFRRGSNFQFQVPFYDNFGDSYTVIASADNCKDAGFTPVKVSKTLPQTLDLMLLPNDASFQFANASWANVQQTYPEIHAILSRGATSGADAKERYENLMEDKAPALACLWNLMTAMRDIDLPSGTPLTYLKQLVWEDIPDRSIGAPAQDRFYAYADKNLVTQVKLAAQQGEFTPELDPHLFHKGATSSYKQTEFGEANVQLTFHEEDTRTIDGVECVVVEPDIDYYKDLAAHTLLEVLANALTGDLTDPKNVYVLRWIAGRRAGVPEFNPPYTIA
ncbi:MAG TPA: hypothetical protein VJN89_21265 [Candidatus Acidoferrum sp.]|nr:hypothetical protein [Candidatus Acidoferrum sp.]